MAPRYVGEFEVPLTSTIPPEDATDMPPYVKQTRRTDILAKGWQKTPETRPLPCNMIFDQVVPVVLRDGVTIYVDIHRPANIVEKIPALLAISPYGKGGHGFDILGNCPFRVGIPVSKTSGLEKFESIDPAEWVDRGYAVVNVDVRGSWESGGDLPWEGTQPGRDGYDVVEYIATLDWCSGLIGMQGNSWLSTTQWTTAIQKPPHLKAIAPWEGFTDIYRHVVFRGGVMNADFFNFIAHKTIRGRQMREDVTRAAKQWPLWNEYWEDKRLKVDQIEIPMYVLASYSSAVHAFGSVKGFEDAQSKYKWLRIHATQEWYDLYLEENNDDLQRFFDRYLKGVENNWEKTPKVRVSILRFNKPPIINQVETEYPPRRTNYRKLFLSSASSDLILTNSAQIDVSSASYQSDSLSAKPVEFTHIFDAPTTLVGYPQAKIWVSCSELDDMDVYLSLRKVDESGRILEHINIPKEALPESVSSTNDVPNANVIKYFGPTGILRVSHRGEDLEKTTDVIPYHPHDKEEKVVPGTIVPIRVGIWPIGIQFEKGEGLVLRIQGFIDQCEEFPQHTGGKPANLNVGRHNIHFGGSYDSYLTVPVI